MNEDSNTSNISANVSASNSPGNVTPSISNPGTPRSDTVEMRNTPPPPAQSQRAGPMTSLTQQHQQQQFLIQHQQHLQHLQSQSKYSQLLAVIEDMGRDIRPTYSGSRTSAERLKRGIVHARILVLHCLPPVHFVMSVTSHVTLDTKLCADSVEWCPLDGFKDILLCGTYQLDQSQDQPESETDKTSQTRLGCLYTHQKCEVDGSLSLSLLESHHMAGILDIKWSHTAINSQPHFALVNSIGQLVVFSLDDQKKMSEVTTHKMSDSCLGLSLEWDNMLCERSHPRITTSDSLGQVHVYQMGEGGVERLSTWKAHDFEAWITAFNQWNDDIVFTGGDDCRLKLWDTRMEPAQPVLSSKRHTMGVCSIQSNPKEDFIIATGSYDEQLLIWDSRHMRQPITELGLGGGIWRIKWEPSAARYILTATMYNGFHIVDASDFKGSGLSKACHYEEHQSIAYGADWFRGEQTGCDNPPEDISKYTIATCSFYDHLLKMWSFDNKMFALCEQGRTL